MLVISCSDARLTAADSAGSWQKRLRYDGPIFEVRCPGGSIALADNTSAFYESARQSYELLAQTRKFDRVVLAAHEDCAYFQTKYGQLYSDAQDRDDLKRWLIDEAVRNVETWEPKAAIETIFMSFLNSDHGHSDHPHGPECATCRERAQNLPANQPVAANYLPPHATQAVIDQFVTERVLSTGDSVDSIMAEFERVSSQRDGIATWRIERRAREFVSLLQSESRRFSIEQQRQLAKSFVESYAGPEMSRTMFRAIMSSLEPDLIAARGRKPSGR